MSKSETSITKEDLYNKFLQDLYIKFEDGYDIITKSKYNNNDTLKIFKHLLHYTYAATAKEVKHHEEVTQILKEIRDILLKHVNPPPQT